MTKSIMRVIIILIALFIIPVYWMRLAFENVTIRDGLFLSTVFMATAGGIYALSNYGLKYVRNITLIGLTAGVGFLLITELLFQYHYLVYHTEIPFPSIADFFALSAYISFFIGLFHEVQLAKVNLRKLNRNASFFVLAAALVLICIIAYFGIYKAIDPEADSFTNFVAMGYGVADLVIISLNLLLLLLVREYRGGRFSRIWLTMLIGFVFLLATDIMWSFNIDAYHNEEWLIKSLLDTTWMLSYLFFAWSLFDFGFSIKDAYKMAGNLDMMNKSTAHLADTPAKI